MKYKKTLVTLGVLGALGGGSYYAWESSFIEDTLSETRIPFEWFVGNKQLKSPSGYEVENSSEPNVMKYKKQTEGLTSLFGEDKTERPDLNNLPMSTKARADLQDKMNTIYGHPNTYVISAVVSGVADDGDGWGPVVTFSSVDDTDKVTNYNYVMHYNDESNELEKVHYLSESVGTSWSIPIPNDYELSKVSRASTAITEYFKRGAVKENTINISKDAESIKDFYKNGVIGRISAIYDTQTVVADYYVGTTEKVQKLTVVYDLKTNSITDIK